MRTRAIATEEIEQPEPRKVILADATIGHPVFGDLSLYSHGDRQ